MERKQTIYLFFSNRAYREWDLFKRNVRDTKYLYTSTTQYTIPMNASSFNV